MEAEYKKNIDIAISTLDKNQKKLDYEEKQYNQVKKDFEEKTKQKKMNCEEKNRNILEKAKGDIKTNEEHAENNNLESKEQTKKFITEEKTKFLTGLNERKNNLSEYRENKYLDLKNKFDNEMKRKVSELQKFEKDSQKKLNSKKSDFDLKKNTWDALEKKINDIHPDQKSYRLNLGGTVFRILEKYMNLMNNEEGTETIFNSIVLHDNNPNCVLNSKIKKKVINDEYEVDRCPELFKHIVEYMRTGQFKTFTPIMDELLIEEARFYEMNDAVALLENRQDTVYIVVEGTIIDIKKEHLTSLGSSYLGHLTSLDRNKDGAYKVEGSSEVVKFLKEYCECRSVETLYSMNSSMRRKIYDACKTKWVIPAMKKDIDRGYIIKEYHRGYPVNPFAKILHISQGGGDANCPVSKKIHPDVKEVTTYNDIIFDDYDCILLSHYSGLDYTILGDLLANYVSKGGNVVLCYLSNTSNNNHPLGSFTKLNPMKLKAQLPVPTAELALVLQPDDKKHPLMTDVNMIKQKGPQIRSDGEVDATELSNGTVGVVGKWTTDGVNFIAVRYNQPGFIIRIGLLCSDSYAEGDFYKLLRNAVSLRKLDK